MNIKDAQDDTQTAQKPLDLSQLPDTARDFYNWLDEMLPTDRLITQVDLVNLGLFKDLVQLNGFRHRGKAPESIKLGDRSVRYTKKAVLRWFAESAIKSAA